MYKPSSHLIRPCDVCGTPVPTHHSRVRSILIADGYNKGLIRKQRVDRVCTVCASTTTPEFTALMPKAIYACKEIAKRITDLSKARPRGKNARVLAAWEAMMAFYPLVWRGIASVEPPPMDFPAFSAKRHPSLDQARVTKNRKVKRYFCACGRWYHYTTYFEHRRTCRAAKDRAATPSYDYYAQRRRGADATKRAAQKRRREEAKGGKE